MRKTIVFKLIGLPIQFVDEAGVFPGISRSNGALWEPFLTAEPLEPVCTVELAVPQSENYQLSAYPFQHPVDKLFRFQEDYLLTDSAWRHCCILVPCKDASFHVLTNQIFLTHAIHRQTLQLHASIVNDRGRGVIFLGPSGIGKTTQAEQWAKRRGAVILNGDMVFVQRTQRGYLGWGTPWHGSSPYCRNANVPVNALVVLKQAAENKLRELTGFEKVAEVSGSVFYPTWLEDGMDLCTELLNHLLTDLPVYCLDNRADWEAVDLLAQELDRLTEGERI